MEVVRREGLLLGAAGVADELKFKKKSSSALLVEPAGVEEAWVAGEEKEVGKEDEDELEELDAGNAANDDAPDCAAAFPA